jgi:hypothetical protein
LNIAKTIKAKTCTAETPLDSEAKKMITKAKPPQPTSCKNQYNLSLFINFKGNELIWTRIYNLIRGDIS